MGRIFRLFLILLIGIILNTQVMFDSACAQPAVRITTEPEDIRQIHIGSELNTFAKMEILSFKLAWHNILYVFLQK